MSYGFKFTNTNGELVIDDSNVKPWYINGSIAGTTNYFGMNYKNVDQTDNYADFAIFNPVLLSPEQPSDNNSDLYHPNGTWHIYELRYIAPDISDCFYAYTLPRSNDNNIWYFTQDVGISQLTSSTAGAGPIHLLNNPKTDILPVPGTGQQYVSIFAMVPDSWAITSTPEQLQAAVPKVYFFSNKEIANNIRSNGYGMQVFDNTAKCMYDSAKIHIQFKGYSFQDWTVPPPPGVAGPDYNGADIRSNFVTTASPPSNTAFVIPTIVQYYYTIDGAGRGILDIYRTMVQRIDSGSDIGSTSTIRTRTVKVTGQTTQALGLGNTISGLASGTWWNYGTNSYTGWLGQQYKTSILAIDSAPLDRGYSASDWPSTFSITASRTTVPESDVNGSVNTVTFTLRTSRVASGYQSAYTISGTNITAGDIAAVYSNGQYVSQGSLTGYFTVVNNIATISLNITEDYVAEGTETLTLSLNSGLASATVSLTEDKAYSLRFIDTPDNTTDGIPGFYESSQNNARAVAFQLLTKNVVAGTLIPWRLSFNSTANASDFIQATSGNFNIETVSVANAQSNGGYNGQAGAAVVINKDFQTEGTERVRLELTNMPTVYKDFDIIDNSTGTPNVTLFNPSSQTSGNVYLDEGTEYIWAIAVTNIANVNGAILYPKLVSGTANAADIAIKDYGTNTANCVILNENGVGVFSITPTADVAREGLENFTLGIYYPQNTKIYDYNGTVYINDTSKPAEQYTLETDVQMASEGQTVSVTVTSRYDYEHPLYWVFTGTSLGSVASAMTLDDIASIRYENLDYLTTGGPQYTNITKSDRGSFSFPTSGTQTEYLRYRIQFTMASDTVVEPRRFGGVDLYANGYPPNGGSLLNTIGWFVDDAPLPTYTITPSATTVNEGDTLVWTITTTNVPNGTVLWWLSLGSAQNIDYNDNLYGTSVTINNNTGTVARTVKADAGAYEGTETSILALYDSSSYTNQIAIYSGSVSINDTSTNVNEVLTITPSSVSYPNPVRVDITGGVPNTRVHFSLDNTSYDGFVDLDASGNYTNTNAGPSEVVGSHTLYLRFDATGHTRQASWTVTAAAPTYSFSRDVSIVDEGQTITYTVNTTNVANGTRVYWINYGSTDYNDFTSYTSEGFVTINNNTGSFYRTLRNDATTEGQETVWIFFYADSGYNDILGYVGQTTVNDTSTTPVSYPPAGTLLSQYCGTGVNQYTRYGNYADGSGGSYVQVIETNASYCGYTPPAGQVVSGYSSTTNDPGNVDVEGSPSAAYDGLRCRGVGRANIDSQVTRTFTVSQAGTITAYLVVSSEANYDFGEIYFDNVQYARGSGEYNSGALTGPITAGQHTIKVRYTTDGSVNSGTDSAFGYWTIT